MSEIYVEDKFTETGLFQSMEQQGLTLPFSMSPTLLDSLYIGLHGIRKLSRIGRTTEVDDCAQLVYNLFIRKWTSQYNLIIKNYNIEQGNITTITETIETDITADTTNDVTNKVSAFNDFVDDENDTTDEEFANNDTSNTTINSVTDNNRNRTYEKVEDKVADRSELLDMLQLNFICDIIFTDVNGILTLSIFN